MLIRNWAIGGVALGALMSASGMAVAADGAAIDARLRALEAEIAKLRKEAHEAKAQAAAASSKATNVANAAHFKADPHAPPPPPPVFVSFKNGIFVETEDKAYSFKVGGRIMVDGGGIAEPLNGFSSQVAFRQIRLEVEGKAAKVWFYKLQYDFAGTGQVTGNNQTLGGIRDFFFGIQHPALSIPWAKDPMFIMVGSQFEPFSLESTSSSKFRPLIERAMAVEGIAPNRHLGISLGAYGDNWTGRIGVFSTSMEDASISPGQNTPAVWGVPKAAGWVSTGGAQYVDAAGRLTYAPIKDEHNLLHFGVSGRYHSPNDATGASDDRVLRLGNRLRSEATVLGQGLLGTPDMSCGSYANGGLFGGVPFSSAAGHCTKYVTSYGFELAGAYGPFDMQAEYIATDYQRDMNKILQARANGVFAPGGSSTHFGGYYAYAQYWLTGEERAQAYSTSDKAGANFFEPKIKNPLSAGGYGAFSLIGRYSSVNLNSGPYSGTGLANMLAVSNPTYAPAGNFLYQSILNAGVAGGRQENVTTGFNWYPDKGVHLQFNWTHVLHVSAPLNDYNIVGAPMPGRQGFYYNGAHPDLFEARAQIYW
ncbi:OprO/OprP family phosphate-selective porin [Methylocystis parvus]|uniref:Carbohydrate porin n=1 Tax=Methylocystis parvus TaxID=134 RepID=A0A6B8M9Q4_9HYPH|nr:porin [Methylocystis parvus]QGM99338.1 carbohydrate porin [Methylocystis parvus]WBK00272.1 OprO/OprP family phosphate-selective porin [Methylocystis parvus OBBP]